MAFTIVPLTISLLLSLFALNNGMHVTVKGRFRCFLPVSYSKVVLFHKSSRGVHRVCVGTTDLNGAYSLSGVIPERFYDVRDPSANLFVVPLYSHESAYRGTMKITRHRSSRALADQTPIKYGVKPGSIVDFGLTKFRSNICFAYYRFMQELSDFARSSGPLPAQFLVTLDAPFPNIRITTKTAFFPRGKLVQYSQDTRPIMRTFIRYNYDGSIRQFRINARKYGYFKELPSDKPTSPEYAFHWAWYRYNAGGGCPTTRPNGRLDIPQVVYQTFFSIYCTCRDNGATFKEIDDAMFDVFRLHPGQVRTFTDFETRFNKITKCGFARIRPVTS